MSHNKIVGKDNTNHLSEVKVHNGALKTGLDTTDTGFLTLAGYIDSIESRLPQTGSGHLAVSINEIGNEGSERLNVDCGSTLTQLPTALTGEGNLKVSIQEDHTHNLATEAKQDVMEATLEVIATNTANIKISTDSVNLNVDTLEALQGTTNTLLTNLDGVADNILLKNTDAEAHLGNIDTGIDVLEACVSSNKMNINISSGSVDLPSGASTSALQGTTNTKLDTLETSLTSMEGKQDTQITHLSEIEGAVETLEGCVGSSKVNVNISSGNITGFATSTLQGTTNTKLDTLETSLTSMETKQDTQITHLSEIEGAVETLEGCVGSSKVNVNISSGSVDLPSGASTSALQGTTNTKLDTLETSLTSMETKQDTQITHLSEIEGAVETLEGCVGSSKVNVNISSGNISGFATSTLQGTTNNKLDTLETSLTSMEGKIDVIDGVLDSIKIDTEAIETAVEALNTRDVLQTTLVVDGESVSSGGGTHTTASFQITKRPKGDGKLLFLVKIATVSPSDIAIAFLASGDNTNFFKLPLSFVQKENTTTGVGVVATLSFIPKHLKVELTNSNFSSAATCSVHMFN